jgi:ankyrin repeat protein
MLQTEMAEHHCTCRLGLAKWKWPVYCVKRVHSSKQQVEVAMTHTPLQVAGMKGRTEVAGLFLEKDADIEASDSYGGFTLLGFAASMSYSLGKAANPEATNKAGHTPLISAARSGFEAVAKLLLNHGARIEATDKSGGAPLIWAATAGPVGGIEHLTHHGANINVSEYSGFTQLREARKKRL